jgi:hypothetical protein
VGLGGLHGTGIRLDPIAIRVTLVAEVGSVREHRFIGGTANDVRDGFPAITIVT